MKIAYLLMLLAFIPFNAQAGRNISLPFSESFNSGDTWTHDLAWLDCGAQAVHLNNGGWTGGAADFKPPTSPCTGGGINGGMSTFGRLQGFNAPQINIRFLLKIGRSYSEDVRDGGGSYINKFIDVHGDSGHRYGILTLNRSDYYGGYLAFGVLGDHETYRYAVSGRGWIEDAPLKIDQGGSNQYTDEWICVEYEIRPSDNSTTVYVWTQDGAFSGPLASATRTQSGMISMVDIGGYFNSYVVNNTTNHLTYDEIRIDTRFIGPPAGFVTGAGVSLPSNPTSVTITQVQ